MKPDTVAQYSSGFEPTEAAWSAPGIHRKRLGHRAAWYSLPIMEAGTKSSSTPWMNSVGVLERATA